MSEAALTPLGLWLRHLLCFVVPLTAFGFVLTGPHPWWRSLLWLLPVFASILIDERAGPPRRAPSEAGPRWPFDLVLYALVGLQLANIVLLARMVSIEGLFAVDTLTIFFLVGVNSGYSAIVVAHELIHRPGRHNALLGRLLLLTVMYEHFYTEHLRGHHVRVSTSEDPATARFDESFRSFWRRTVPGQFKSAWRLEAERLGDPEMGCWDRRVLRSRVVHGLLAELALAATLTVVFGWAALGAFLWQALAAVRLLEVVNYFEHWGLQRRGRKVTAIDSWDSDSWFTTYTLIGLSRHADHHAHPARPYPELRLLESSPKLAVGYFGTAVMVLAQNRRFITQMRAELERAKLGPFAPPESASVSLPSRSE